MDDKPWRYLPPKLAAAVRPALPALADEILAALRERVPDYDRPLRGEFGRGIRRGVEDALAEFLQLIGDPEGGDPDPRVYRALGRGELQSGRSLDALQSAYRVGARVAWRRTSELAQQAGLSPDDQRQLAESIFAYIDELASLSVAGYAEAQAREAGELQRRRRRLARMLLAREREPEAALSAAADEAAWPLPRDAAAVALGGGDAARFARRLGPDVLVAEDDAGPPALIAPDAGAPGFRRRLEAALEGTAAACGPAVPVREVATSLRWARRALTLDGRGLVWADDHLAELALLADTGLTGRLATRALAPLDELPGSRGDRLAETLLAWLRAQGHRPTVATMLHVHPQTVRYRLAQLREHLGDRLDDPDERFALELALRARALQAPEASASTAARS